MWARLRCPSWGPSQLSLHFQYTPGSVSTHPMTLYICFEVVHVTVHQAPRYNDFRAIIEVRVIAFGEIQDGVLRIFHFHIHQQWVSNLLVETLVVRSGPSHFRPTRVGVEKPKVD